MMLAENKWLVELTTQAIPHLLFLGAMLSFAGQQKCFLSPSPFITQNIRKCVFKGGDFMKLIIFTVLSKTFLRKIGFLYLLVFLLQGLVAKNKMTTCTSGCCCFDPCKGKYMFIYHSFCTIGTTVNTAKKAKNVLVL